MNKKNLVAFVVVSTVVGSIFGYNHLIDEICERFPELDRKVVRKAYRNLNIKAFSGKLPGDPDNISDAEMDILFLKEVDALHK